jgi:hypothetical protein
MVRWEESIQQPGLGAGDFLPALPSAPELPCDRKTSKVLNSTTRVPVSEYCGCGRVDVCLLMEWCELGAGEFN